MRRTSFLLAACAALALVLTPTLVEARAGGGSSAGSRGTRTFSAPPSTATSPGSAQPMQRSMTPATPSQPSAAAPLGAPARSGFGSGLMGGLMGGLLGVGLGSMLFGHGMGGFGGFFVLLLQVFLGVMLVRFLFRLFRPAAPAMAGGPSLFARQASPQDAGRGPMPGGGSAAAAPIAIAPADFQAFEQLLKSVQAAWTAQDLNALRGMATPEMLSYFSEQLSDQASRGVRNSVTDVTLQQGDLSEAWSEQGRDYATVAMKFSMVDVTTDAAGRIVDGSPNEHVTVTELWTFLRGPGGRWLLSAIQQVR